MSKKRRIASVVAVFLLAVGILAVSDLPRPLARADEDSVLEQSMGKLNRGFRSIRSPVAAGDFAAVLQALPAMQEGAVHAKGEIPPRIAAEKDSAKRAEQQKRFRLQMIGLLSELLELEKAAIAGDKEKLTASFEKVRGIQKAGHDEFQEPEEKEHGGR